MNSIENIHARGVVAVRGYEWDLQEFHMVEGKRTLAGCKYWVATCNNTGQREELASEQALTHWVRGLQSPVAALERV